MVRWFASRQGGVRGISSGAARSTGESALAQIRREGLALRVSRRGASVLTRLMTARAAALSTLMPMEKEADTSKKLRCPMPGLVVSIVVAEGQQVAAGETLAIVEAMKMENVLRAERSGTIARILARPGTASLSTQSSWNLREARRMPQTRTIKVRISGLVQGVGFRAWTRAAGERARPLGLGEELRQRRC